MEHIKVVKTLDQRKSESAKMREKYPTRICIYLTPNPKSKNTPELDKRKFLVPEELVVGQLLTVIRKRSTIKASEGIYLFTDDNMSPGSSTLLGDVYKEKKDIDGFLYMTYSLEETFGH